MSDDIIQFDPNLITEPEAAPEGGWKPDDFAAVTVAMIPYTSNSMVKPDPYMSIHPDEWMYVETGNVRIAFPDQEEWAKFVRMGNAMWVSHHQAMAIPAPEPVVVVDSE